MSASTTNERSSGSTETKSDGGLNTPLVKLSPAATIVVTVDNDPIVDVISADPPLETAGMLSTGELEAAMRINPFDVGFRYAANSTANAAILQRTPSGTTITLVDDFITLPNALTAQSPALTPATISSALMMLNNPSGDQAGQIQTPDIIRRALLRASTSSSNSGAGVPLTPQTADIVQRLIELSREESLNNQQAAAPNGSPPDLNSPPNSVIVPTVGRASRQSIKTEVVPSASATGIDQPVMISVQIGGQQVQVPIHLNMQHVHGGLCADGSIVNGDLHLTADVAASKPKMTRYSATTKREYLSAEPATSRDSSVSPRPQSGSSHNDGGDPRRADILQRNREAAVRYRKRKRVEQTKMAEATKSSEKTRMSLEARVSVLQRELDQAHHQLRHFQMKCTCDAAASSSTVTSPSIVTTSGSSMLLYRDASGRNVLISADTLAAQSTVVISQQQPIAPHPTAKRARK